jgi:hypothetical protein
MNSPKVANAACLYLGTPKIQKDSFPKLTQFSKENNMLDAPSSIMDGFLLRDTCVSST